MESSVDGARSFEINPVPGTYWPKFVQVVSITSLPYGVGMMLLMGMPMVPGLIMGFAFGIGLGVYIAPRLRQATLRASPPVPNAALSLALSELGYYQESASLEASTWRQQEVLGRTTRVIVHQKISETLIIGPARAVGVVKKSLAQANIGSAPPADESVGANSAELGDSATIAPSALAVIPQVGFGEASASESGSSKTKRLGWMVVVLVMLTGGAAAVAYNVLDTQVPRCSDPEATQLVRKIIGKQLLPKLAWKGTDAERANAFVLTNVGTSRANELSRDCFGNLWTNKSGLDLMISRFKDRRLDIFALPLTAFRMSHEGMLLKYNVQRLDDGRVSVMVLTTHILD